MPPKNTRVPIVYVVSGAVTVGAGCVFARKDAHAESFPCRSKLSSMKKIIKLMPVSNDLFPFLPNRSFSTLC